MDPLAALARKDKWFLGCGDGILFAPPFPVWLDAPGFWDEATVYQYGFGPLFTVSVVTDGGEAVQLQPVRREWTPAELVVEYAAPGGWRAEERRSVHPGGTFASEWCVRGLPEDMRALHLVAWTVQETAGLDLASLRWEEGAGMCFVRTVRDRRDVPLAVRAELTLGDDVRSWSASLSEGSALQPHWRFTPFPERWEHGGLDRRVRTDGLTSRGLLYAAVHAELQPADGVVRGTATMRLVPADRGLQRATGSRRAHSTVGAPSWAARSRERWSSWFASVPHLTCSDPYLERYYWYRWYGLYLNAIAPGTGHYEWPTMCEGIQFFHQPITYSAQCHVRELRWVRDPEWARGVLRTIFRRQKPDGALHGRIYVNHLEGTDYYHANWGDALLALDAVAPDDAVLRELYPSLARHAEWLWTRRDDGTGMIDVVDQYETGQEYMSRYQAIDPNADSYGWENRLRLKGIDVTVYAYQLVRALAELAPRVGRAGDSARWTALADRSRSAMREQMWDADGGMFSDVDPRTGARTGVRAAVCFYPYFTDVADVVHLTGLERNLLDPARFWTPFPVPSSSLDDPMFDARAEWKGKRHVCPWNGRVWPMTNSHAVEALGRWATPDRPHLRHALVHLVRQFVRMMFHQGDVTRPNCYEHYNPFTGAASEYRGIDDYQHSWVADLLIQYVAGVRPRAGGVVIDPFPFGLPHARLAGAVVAGHPIDVAVDTTHFTVTVDGATVRRPLGEPLTIDW